MDQQIIHGIGALAPLLAGKRVFLVRDSAFEHLEIRTIFDAIPHTAFSGFTPNPQYEQVAEGVRLFNSCRSEIIVAVGGGSTIDVAKCIKMFCRMDPAQNYLEQEKQDTGVPLIAVPTTAGTGSESTRHAVIYHNGAKQSISHASIVPDYAVLEPSVLKTLPAYQKKCTLMDALAQAIESWWSVSSTDESKAYSRKAIAGIVENWEAYIFDGSDHAAAEIMEAANSAGQAINITATTAAHAMSYKLTSLYGLPHGHAVAVCLPEVWTYMLDHPQACTDRRGPAYLEETLNEIGHMITPDDFRRMLERMALAYPQANVRREEIPTLVGSVNPIRLKNNPVLLTEDALNAMYERIVQA